MKNSEKKIAIIGTVGIPAKYGGFETLVEYLTKHLGSNHELVVYCSSKNYPIKLREHNNATLKYIPLKANGIQSVFYDIISLFMATSKADVILILGVSGCIILPIYRLFYNKKKLVINIDGLEHRREKWSKWAKRFLKLSEKLAIKHANELIADNQGIVDYVKKEYQHESNLITYGADHVKKIILSEEVVQKYNLPNQYAFKVCRIEPENNIHLILDAFKQNNKFPLVIIGNWNNSNYGLRLFNKYKDDENLRLLSPIYDQDVLNQIRGNSRLYIHGHSAGGTNPSLVEAMFSGLPVIAFDVNYNRATTFNEALYFKNTKDLSKLLNSIESSLLNKISLKMKEIADENYTWELISEQYSKLF